MKKLIVVVLCLLILSGCTVISESKPYIEEKDYSPIPTATGQPWLTEQGRVIKPALYFLDSDKKRLVTELRPMTVNQGENPAEVVVRELLAGAQTQGLEPVSPGGIILDSVQIAANIANVYLSALPAGTTFYEVYVLKSALANTLINFTDIDYVNVFFGNLEKGFEENPYGPQQKTTEDIESAYTKIHKSYIVETPEETPEIDEEDAQTEEAEPVLESIDTVLYFLSAQGDYILPEVRTVTYEDGKYLEGIIAELKKGPADGETRNPCVPADLEFLNDPEIIVNDDGTVSAVLNFSKRPTPFAYEDIENEKYSYASIVYSLTGFIPNLKTVEIKVAGKPIYQEIYPAAMSRQDFSGIMGGSITLYFLDEDSPLLIRVTRAVEQKEVWDARVWLSELIKGPAADEDARVWPAVRSGITSDDILDIYLNNETLTLDLSANFKQNCADLSAEREMLLVYSIVNTLTELDGVKRIQFLIEGERVETLSGGIYLYNEFVCNPGLIKE